MLVVNGDRDPFGVPDAADASRVVVPPGQTHALSRRPETIGQATRTSWLREVLGARRPPPVRMTRGRA